MSETFLPGSRILLAQNEVEAANRIELTLAGAGVIVVGPYDHLRATLDAAREDALEAAVLDPELGGEPAWSVLDALLERGIPFLLTDAARRAPVRRHDIRRHDALLPRRCPGPELLSRLGRILAARRAPR